MFISKNIPKKVIIDNKSYFSVDYIYIYDPTYFVGTYKNLRGIVNKKNIQNYSFTYAYFKNGKLTKSNESYVKAKLYLDCVWCNLNIPKMILRKEKLDAKIINKPIIQKRLSVSSDDKIINKPIIQMRLSVSSDDKTIVHDLFIANTINKSNIKKPSSFFNQVPRKAVLSSINSIINNNIFSLGEDLYDAIPTCDIIVLDKKDMFKLLDNIIDIEIRGERNCKKCYFKLNDIIKQFNLSNLFPPTRGARAEGGEKNIKDNKTTYIYNDDYVLFNLNNNKELFLTYSGLLHALYKSQYKYIKEFQKWLIDIFFVVHKNTQKASKIEVQKHIVSRDISNNSNGISLQTIKEVFNSNTNKTPVVYLFNIGSANQLLKTNIYLESDILCKFGCTEDINRRTTEHERNFKKQYDVTISLLFYSIIDSKYIFDAEMNIKQYFLSNKISSDDKTELVIISKKNINQIKQHYKMIQNVYIGKYVEMNNKITELEKRIIEINHQLIIKNKELEIKDKDILLEKQKSEILEIKLKIPPR